MEGACTNTCTHSIHMLCLWFMVILWAGFTISECDGNKRNGCCCCFCLLHMRAMRSDCGCITKHHRILTYFDNISTASLIWIQSHFILYFISVHWFYSHIFFSYPGPPPLSKRVGSFIATKSRYLSACWDVGELSANAIFIYVGVFRC